MRDRETPLNLVRLWPKIMPGCYDALEILSNAKTAGDIWWPDYCLLPINAAFTYLCNAGLRGEEAASVAAELTACWMWRKNKVIYSFDSDLAEVLAAQAERIKDTEVLPVDLLFHTPYPIFYVKASNILRNTDGFFFWMDFDVNRKTHELRIQWLDDDLSHSFPHVLHIIPGASIWDCIWDTIKTSKDNLNEPAIMEVKSAVEIARPILRALQLVLYLLAENTEVEEDSTATINPKSVRGSDAVTNITDKAKEITSYSVGVRIGSTIRKAKAGSTSKVSTGAGAPKRPHSRRGHWHHYWTGPRDGQRELILRWIAPTFIHANSFNGEQGNVVIYPVKE